MTETVNAPTAEAEGAESTEATAEAKPVVSLRDRLNKAMQKQMPAQHEGFVKWMADNSDVAPLDLATVLAVQSLYTVYRQSPEYAKIKAETPTTTREVPMPTTPEEAKAALEKIKANQDRRAAQQAREEARAAKIRELLASVEGSGDEASPDSEPAETDEDMAEAF